MTRAVTRGGKPVLAVSMGDPAGIGAEVVVAAAATGRVRKACRMVVFGDRAVLDRARWALRLPARHDSAIMHVEEVTRLRNGPRGVRPSKTAGEAAFRYLDAAARGTRDGRYDALVTAPINKLWLQRAGHLYDGHTGYLSELAGRRATMMLAGRRLRVVLVTTHIAHAAVSAALTVDGIRSAARTVATHLRTYHGLARPRLAVAALNPHAGEGGVFGDEELRIIAPAVRSLRRERLDVGGPFPADTLFATVGAGNYDAVVCMYHDQGLIPLKLLEFGRAVNVSMGLPFIRTSPDHGTAYDLVGSGKAEPGSMIEALLAAAAMVRSSGGGRGRER